MPTSATARIMFLLCAMAGAASAQSAAETKGDAAVKTPPEPAAIQTATFAVG
jgi:hypothetical protein